MKISCIKYEVSEWYADKPAGMYSYHRKLTTKWLVVALWKMWVIKRNGAGCVKLELR